MRKCDVTSLATSQAGGEFWNENIIFIALLNMILQFYHIYVWS